MDFAGEIVPTYFAFVREVIDTVGIRVLANDSEHHRRKIRGIGGRAPLVAYNADFISLLESFAQPLFASFRA